MKAYKLLEDKKLYLLDLKKGRLLIELPYNTNYCIAATATEKQHVGYGKSIFQYLKVEEVDLLKEKWVHPHLLKVIKEQVKKQLNESI